MKNESDIDYYAPEVNCLKSKYFNKKVGKITFFFVRKWRTRIHLKELLFRLNSNASETPKNAPENR